MAKVTIMADYITAVVFLTMVLLINMTYQLPSPHLNYTCPLITPGNPCQCATESAHVLDKVQVHCAVLRINENTPDFSTIQSRHTTVLYLQCDQLFASRFYDNMLSHLRELRELAFIGCKFQRLYSGAFRGLEQLKVLNISYAYHIDFTIAESAFKFAPNLEFLDLSSLKIRQVPTSLLCDTGNIKYVDLSNNQLSDEGNCGYLSSDKNNVCARHLSTLKLDDNLLTEISVPLVHHIPRIANLHLYGNRLTKLSNNVFSDLEFIRIIDLSQNRLSQIPPDVFQGLETLIAVGLAHNRLTCLSSTLFNDNHNLTAIKLGHNRLTSDCLPIVSHLTMLQILDLSFNRIQTIPNGYFNFTDHTSNIQYLYLEGNQLSDIDPTVFRNLESVKFLNMSKNLLQDFTLDVALNQLQHLDLSSNILMDDSLQRLDCNLMQNLVEMSLGDNRLSVVPKCNVTMNQLVILKLNKNNISSIKANSSDFTNYSALKLLDLHDNYMNYLPKNAFKLLPELNYLDLSWNYIQTLEYTSFSGLRNLQILNLNYNKLTDIHAIFTHTPNLHALYVRNNMIQTVGDGDIPGQVVDLDLSNNRITSLGIELLLHLPLLQRLDLQQNKLRRIYQTSLLLPRPNTHRPFVMLSGNFLFCDCNMRYLQDLNEQSPSSQGHRYAFIGDITNILCESLTPGKTYKFLVDLNDNDFLCAYCAEVNLECGGTSVDRYCEHGCQCCDDDGDMCYCRQMCPDQCMCTYNTDRTYNSINCSNRGLTQVPTNPLYFATHIRFDGNNISSLEEGDFQYDHDVEVLYLNNSNIQEIDSQAFFANVTKLETLYLNNNRLKEIRNDSFASLGQLKALFLQNNYIHRLENGAFNGLTSLKELYLNNNNMSTVSMELLDSISHVPNLYLSGNSWTCDCQFGLEFQTWLNKNSRHVKDVPSCKVLGDFITVNSTTEYRITWVNFDPCKNLTITVPRLSRTLLSIIITLLIILALFITCLILIYKYRDLFLVWIYTKYGVRFREVKDDADKDYDAFISYSSLDESFVVHELAPILEEGNPPYRLCLHYRDWMIGSVIAESIISSVHSSRRTILLLSKNFVDSEWCNYEFQTAHHQVLKDKTCRLIVVLLDDELPQGIDEQLSLYIQSHTYIRRSDPWFVKRLRYALPDVSEEQKEERWEAKRKEKEMLKKTREVMISLNVGNAQYTKA